MADWWNPGDFNLGFDTPSFDPSWFNVPDFNFNWDFSIPDFNWAWNVPDFNLGFDPSFFQFNDPLALPQWTDFTNQWTNGQTPGFDQFGIPDPSLQGIGGGASPLMLSDALGFKGTAAPTATMAPTLPQGSDPLTNLMGTDQGLGATAPNFDLEQFLGAPAPVGGNYTTPFSTNLDLGQYEGASGPPTGGGMGEPRNWQEALAKAQIDRLNNPKEPSTIDTIAKLGAAFGPVALGGAGLLMQGLNQPKRNPLEDDLLRARIQSTGLQDTLARDRLDFERQQAEANREFQMEMQNALLESRRPGGQANIDALLKGNPQLAALYQALTGSTTGLASGQGSPEFQAMIEQVAQVDIAELRRQAEQQKAQAMELASRQGINPANIIAEIEQRFLQESAKARANARQTLIAQLQPGISVLNSLGGLFGGLFQTPSAG